jgi:ADP-ribose pyrophosphatase YjhB (NUDIX family)
VVVAVTVKDDRFVLIKRGIPPKKGYWGCPSGFVECGETPEEACLRELEEEAGVKGEIRRLLRVARREDTELYGDMLVVTYLVDVVEGEPSPGEEADDARYFAEDEIPAYLMPVLRSVIDEMRTGG